MANQIFCRAMAIVRRAMEMAVAILPVLSSISTISADSIAASLPKAPIAMPTSARFNTGASFMPSPTKARPLFSPFSPSNRSTSATLSAGRSSELYSSMPSCFATSSATSRRSPVSMTTRFTPIVFSFAMASRLSAFTLSFITMYPAYCPSTAT